MLISKLKFQKKGAHLYTQVNRFVCNILDMMILEVRGEGEGGVGEWGAVFSGRYM